MTGFFILFRLLENYGVIHREVYPVVPPKVEYSLTNMGKDFLPILDSINQWAEKFMNNIIFKWF